MCGRSKYMRDWSNVWGECMRGGSGLCMKGLGTQGMGRYIKLFGVEDRRVRCLMGGGSTWRHGGSVLEEKEAGHEGSRVPFCK